MDSSDSPNDADATHVEAAPVSPRADPAPPYQVAPPTRLNKPPDQEYLFKGINNGVTKVDAIIRAFCDANARSFERPEFLAYGANNLRPKTLISTEAQPER